MGGNLRGDIEKVEGDVRLREQKKTQEEVRETEWQRVEDREAQARTK